jgi:hypothetical protein
MAADLILQASTSITVNDAAPRAESVAVDTTSGVVLLNGAWGSL